MKKALLFLFMFIAHGLFAQKNGYTKDCDEKCVIAYHGLMYVCNTENFEDCEPARSTVFGMLRYGEVLETDTSDATGEFKIPIPDFQETDYYLLQLFASHRSYSCMGEYLDTLVWDNYPEILKERIYCLKHGQKMAWEQSDLRILKHTEIKVFPNPASDFATVTFDEPFSGKIRLLNMSGISVLELPVELQKEIIVPLQNMNGLYYMQISDRRGVSKANLKLIVVH